MKYLSVQNNIHLSSVKGKENLEKFEKEFKNNMIEFLEHRECSGLSLLIFSEKAIDSPYFTKSQLSRMTLDQLKDLTVDLNVSFFGVKTKADYIESFLSMSIQEYFDMLYQTRSLKEIDHDFKIADDGLKNIIKVIRVGKVDKRINSETLFNLYFDVPLVGGFKILEDNQVIATYNLNEFKAFDEYAVRKKDDIVNIVSVEKDFITEHKDLIKMYIKLQMGENFNCY